MAKKFLRLVKATPSLPQLKPQIGMKERKRVSLNISGQNKSETVQVWIEDVVMPANKNVEIELTLSILFDEYEPEVVDQVRDQPNVSADDGTNLAEMKVNLTQDAIVSCTP